MPTLLTQIPPGFKVFMGGGAYDGDPVYHAVQAKQVEAEVVIAPHKTAVRSADGDSQRDGHITVIGQHGRMTWDRETR